MSTPPKFHWHSRVKTGGPENINGDVETIPSHVSDENSHPSYLKKGQAVPSGQALYVMEQHRASTLSHVKNLVRRDELLGSHGEGDEAVKDYYNANNNTDYNKSEANYSAATPIKHVITSYALRCILQDYAPRQDLEAGDGTNLIMLHNGVASESDADIGTETRPVRLANGRITPLQSDAVMTGDVDQSVSGQKTFTKVVPRVSDISIMPKADVDLVTVAYLKQARQIPVGFCMMTNTTVLNDDGTDTGTEYTSAKVAEKLQYGEWEKIAELGHFAYVWLRIG